MFLLGSELRFSSVGLRGMSSPGVLVITEAKWGTVARTTEPLTVTDNIQRLAADRGAGRFLFISRYEDKNVYVVSSFGRS